MRRLPNEKVRSHRDRQHQHEIPEHKRVIEQAQGHGFHETRQTLSRSPATVKESPVFEADASFPTTLQAFHLAFFFFALVLPGGKERIKVLNNFVSELMNAKERGLLDASEVSFMNPRDGWCYFAFEGGAQVRLDILNVTNLINKNWGVSQSFVTTQPLIVPTTAQGGPANASGATQYRLATVGAGAAAQLITESFRKNVNVSDVWRLQLGVRYTFN